MYGRRVTQEAKKGKNATEGVSESGGGRTRKGWRRVGEGCSSVRESEQTTGQQCQDVLSVDWLPQSHEKWTNNNNKTSSFH